MNLPELYVFLWNNYWQFFDSQGYFVVTPFEVMSTLRELWQHAEFWERNFGMYQELRLAQMKKRVEEDMEWKAA